MMVEICDEAVFTQWTMKNSPFERNPMVNIILRLHTEGWPAGSSWLGLVLGFPIVHAASSLSTQTLTNSFFKQNFHGKLELNVAMTQMRQFDELTIKRGFQLTLILEFSRVY